MTFNFDEIIEKTLTEEWGKVRMDVIANYDRKGMRASGKLADSLEVIFERRSVKLMGNQYAEQLEYGRKSSSKMPPLQSLFEWVVQKGLISSTEKQYKIKGLAFMIAKKIQREGYDRKDHGGVNLVSEILTDQRIKSIIDLVGQNLFGIFEAEIKTFFNDLEA